VGDDRAMRAMCSVDGILHTEREALVPVLEAGFLGSRCVAEAMRTEAGWLLAWPEHLARLRARAGAAGLELPDDRSVMRCVVDTMRASGFPACDVRIRVFERGDAGAAGGAGVRARATWIVQVGAPPSDPAPLRLGFWRPDGGAAPAWLAAGGGSGRLVIVSQGERGRVDGGPEGRSLFVWHRGRWRTPSVDDAQSCVERDLLLDCCRRHGVVVERCELTADDVRACDDAFFVGTRCGIEPIGHVDCRALHDGAAGRLATDLAAVFEDHCIGQCRDRYQPALAALLAS
jgi:branched-subunit amino acid aminotransferase/4-amino-4-deoxychorismate lyase